jgi:hypothetical protein
VYLQGCVLVFVQTLQTRELDLQRLCNRSGLKKTGNSLPVPFHIFLLKRVFMGTHPLCEQTIHCLEGDFGYIDGLKLFFYHFKSIPSVQSVQKINPSTAAVWIIAQCVVVSMHYHSCVSSDPFSSAGEQRFFVLANRVVLHLEGDKFSVIFDEEQQAFAENMIAESSHWKDEKKKNVIDLVIFERNHLDTYSLPFTPPELDLGGHYNNDLLPVHDLLKEVLASNRSGLVLLHGAPGTGKSTYIRHVISLTEKKVIFITPELAGSMGTPELARFLISNANSVFVIEDAEQLMVSREKSRATSISTLLNLTDGILGESLGIQIIATFNTNLYNIDKALLRKGRMLAKYEFKLLERDKSASLMKELGHADAVVSGPMSLADIFNYEKPGFDVVDKRAIGFVVR